jgi:WD40 repeat protein
VTVLQITSVCFSVSGELLATGGWNGSLSVWSTTTDDVVRYDEAPGCVASIVLSPSFGITSEFLIDQLERWTLGGTM